MTSRSLWHSIVGLLLTLASIEMVLGAEQDKAALAALLKPGELSAFDPSGKVIPYLKKAGVTFVEIKRLDQIPEKTKLVLVGPDALSDEVATGPLWKKLMSQGIRLLVLDQAWPSRPINEDALPLTEQIAEFKSKYVLDPSAAHPFFKGIDPTAWAKWPEQSDLYVANYRIGSPNVSPVARPVEDISNFAPIVVYKTNKSLAVCCQMVVGRNLTHDPIAQRLFCNMLAYVVSAKIEARETLAVLDKSSTQATFLTAAGIVYQQADDLISSLSNGANRIVMVNASPAHLAELRKQPDALKSFTDGGGWLVLWQVTPDGLDDFNALVGQKHIMRPGEFEYAEPTPEFQAETGLRHEDFILDEPNGPSGYTYPVDLDNIAPFAKWPGADYWLDPQAKIGWDHWPRNMVNGFTSTDSWQYTFSFHLGNKEPTQWTVELPKQEIVTGFSIVPNTLYHHISEMKLSFDDGKQETVALRPDNIRQDFSFVGHPTQKVTFSITAYDQSGTADVVGVDNLWLKVDRPALAAAKVRPLLQNGSLVIYPQGKGGILLDQLAIPSAPDSVFAHRIATLTRTYLFELGATIGDNANASAGNKNK